MSIKKLFPQKLKNAYHLAQAIAANVWYAILAILRIALQAGPSRKIKIIGITGTNGKTTTCQMVFRILEESGRKVAMASTINFKLGDAEWVNKTKFTTVSAFGVQKFIAKAVKEGCEYLVLETSSHSLDQYRVWGIRYDTAVITNVTREHLDYHKTMEQYRRAKLKLFQNVKTAIVNLDMERPEEFLSCNAENVYGYTTKKQETRNKKQETEIVQAENIKFGIDGSEFEIDKNKFKLNLPGLFNVENALAATCVGYSLGIGLDVMSAALGKIKKVPGRMDEVENNLGIKIIIDYALTPDSMEKLGELIESIKKPENKLIWVFGSCGDRDRGKRPIMGEIVAKYADFAIVTNEDPYGEDPVRIINEVFSGVIGRKIDNEFLNFKFQISNLKSSSNDKISNAKEWKEGENCWRILDRREAISAALKIAKTGDIILVTGKGAEETMMIGKKMIAWNDQKVIEEELGKI